MDSNRGTNLSGDGINGPVLGSKFKVEGERKTLNTEPGTLNSDARREQERSHAYL
jgi:hypothetical protein